MTTADLEQLLSGFRPDHGAAHSLTVQKALLVARRLQERAAEVQTSAERRQQAELDRLLQNPADKSTLAQITDQAFRTQDPHRAVEHLIHILDVQGVPRFFSPVDRTLLKGFQTFGAYAPGVALPLVKGHMQQETANVILPGEPDMLTQHLRNRTREGVRMNVNFLGEAILSEAEAARRLEQYFTSLQWPEIEVVSIKISTLYSQISPLARGHTVNVLCDRLERLFRAAAEARFTRADGRVAPKFVYLDMEEYRDKELTSDAFMRALDRPGLEHAAAGIALQSYIPDSFETLRRIQSWARDRVANGGSRVTVRIVKGANMEMERVEASAMGWPQAPFPTKLETDANYKRMLHAALEPDNLAAMNVGVASHNLFDLAYGLVLAHERGALDHAQFEMLEGMANQQRRALFEFTRNVLLYAPACEKKNFINAIGYLIRRLDENTGRENFLRHAFRLRVDSNEWRQLESGFLAAFDAIDRIPSGPRRTQDRRQPPAAPTREYSTDSWLHFHNEPDTDFSLPQNSQWAAQLLQSWQNRAPADVPIVIAGEERFDGALRDCIDPSRLGAVAGRYRQAAPARINEAVACAAADPDGWRSLPPAGRWRLLGGVAQQLRLARASLIGAALANAGKTIAEADPEVSEAVDFLELYRDTARWWQEMPTLSASPAGVVAVASPWNFPIAIPCGGVAAALAAGNTVILKPSSDAVLVAWELCQCFWRAGVSRRTLQFAPCSVQEGGRTLVNHPDVNAVILTGGTNAARQMLAENPRLALFAETGGKNATIVTALSDRDQAVKHVLHSAFSHAGQKCSATSLLLLEAEVYDDPHFRRLLTEAVESIQVGSAWKLASKMGPLIRPPSGELQWALQRLDPGEEWAVAPRPLGDNPNLWTPGVKYGVKPGSRSHLTEFFGPVLSVMRFDRLAEAVALVNQTGYGLTSGLESLDEREWDYWRSHIRAGNLYINRVTTGAVVLRQPFGGMAKSVFGPGMKAGGPNYVAQFMHFADKSASHAADLPRLFADLVAGYEAAWKSEFGVPHDHFRLVGQDNFRDYVPLGEVLVRVHPDDTAFDIFARVCAAHVSGNHVTVSAPPAFHSPALQALDALTEPWGAAVEFVEQSDDEVAEAIRDGGFERIRYAAPQRIPANVAQSAGSAGARIVSVPVLAEGRLECLWYLRERSASIDYHRYGNLGARAQESRAPVA